VRRRLLITYVTLLVAVLAGLNIPLAVTRAASDAQTMFIDRLNDTARFASLAEPALRTGQARSLEAELRQYDAMFDIAAAVVARDSHLVLASRAGFDVDDPVTREHLDAALSGERAPFRTAPWPGGGGPLIVAEPVGTAGEIIGAVVTVSPTAALHAGTWRGWALQAALSMLIILIGWAAAAPLARWMLRPVRELDDAAHRLAEGRFSDRVPVGLGPPELRRLATSFNAMTDRIATLVERQRSFVSYASHQLRTPLATLRLCVDNLSPSVRPGGLDDLRLVTEEIERMADMCDALLTYAKAEATAEESQDVDAAAIAEQRVAVWRQAAGQAGIRLVRTGRSTAPVRTAAQALDQALDALISNAVKFAGRGAEVVVTVALADRGWVEIHVVDDGPGMPPEDVARAVEPFWRRPTDQNVEGSGLGITVADALVAASGGRLDLTPARPHGLHARIRLPAAQSAATAGPAGPAGPTGAEA
jgi:signal transduction histidine kinase